MDELIEQIVGNHQEHLVDYRTREQIANKICNEVNKHIPNHYQADCKILKEEGMMPLGQLLSKEQVDDIHDYLRDKKVYNSHVPRGDGIQRPLEESISQFKSNCYDPKDLIGAPHLMEVAISDKILSIVSSYLGCMPTLYSMNLWWTGSGDGQGVQSYHRDLDDFRFLALFIYLVDVDDEASHVFVKFTHDQNILEKIIPDQQLVSRLFPPNPFPYPSFDQYLSSDTLLGSAGSGYLLDTFAIHKGSGNVRKRRLVLWLRYGIRKAPPSREQIPHPYPAELAGNIKFNEITKYVTRVLLQH